MSINIKDYVNSYEFDCVLPGTNEVINFKPITTGQLKKMLPYENESNILLVEQLLDNLISTCVLSEGFDINSLYLQDRFFLLLEIRKKSKGEIYKFTYNCPKCKTQTPVEIDLNNLDVVKKSDNNKPFELNDKMSFDMDNITRGEQKKCYDIVEKMNIENEHLKQAEIATYMYAMAMKTFHTPDGDIDDVSIEDKVDLIDNQLQDQQYKDFTSWFIKNDFGVKFKFDFNCNNPDCGNTEELMIPISNFFV